MTTRTASSPSEAARAWLEPLYDAALTEILVAIREALDRGDAPRPTTEPEVSLQATACRACRTAAPSLRAARSTSPGCSTRRGTTRRPGASM